MSPRICRLAICGPENKVFSPTSAFQQGIGEGGDRVLAEFKFLCIDSQENLQVDQSIGKKGSQVYGCFFKRMMQQLV
jgi:hypothetical protein